MLNRSSILLLMLVLACGWFFAREGRLRPANAQPPAVQAGGNSTSSAHEGGAPAKNNARSGRTFPTAKKKASPSKTEPAADTKKEREQALEQNAQSTLELALKTISLSQGEDGFEIWRLKAEWANIQKEDGKIVVQQPKLTYFLKEEGKTLFVTSDTGIIDQKEQILSFNNHVRIVHDDKSIQGGFLVYNGTAKTMTFPQGGDFTGSGVSGSASNVVWDINRHTITAEGDVSVFFAGAEPSMPLTPEQEKEDEE